jgi:hypothetical protein
MHRVRRLPAYKKAILPHRGWLVRLSGALGSPIGDLLNNWDQGKDDSECQREQVIAFLERCKETTSSLRRRPGP